MGPWYAMFPTDFALSAIAQHSLPGDAVLDPFMGRGTTLAAASVLGRDAAGIEINPIAWLYARTKVDPASHANVLRRLGELEILAKHIVVPELPEFFAWAFCKDVLKLLIAARTHLRWKDCKVDRTLMAFILVDLHGKAGVSLSNQMRQTKSMAPDYAVRWWKARGMDPKPLDGAEIIRDKLRWRYRHGVFKHGKNVKAIHGDSTNDLRKAAAVGPFSLLLTSPPYCGIVNYNYDQWIRRWMLGGQTHPTYSNGNWQDKFQSRDNYRKLIETVFRRAAPLLTPDARILVRVDAREFTLDTVANVLEDTFPKKTLRRLDRPFIGKTQTHLFGDKTEKPGEIDLFMEA